MMIDHRDEVMMKGRPQLLYIQDFHSHCVRGAIPQTAAMMIDLVVVVACFSSLHS